MTQFVFLIRHAQTDYRPDRLAGRTPGVRLSEDGRSQAKALAERLAPVRFTAAYSSPLERCRETAEAVVGDRGLDLRVDEGLLEVDFGTWQGRPYKVLGKTALWGTVQHLPSQARFPDGETVREMQSRGVEAVERIRAAHKKGAIAIFSHADMIKAIAAHYLGMHLDLFQRIVIDYASATVIGFGDRFPRVLRISDTGAFDGLAPAATRTRGTS